MSIRHITFNSYDLQNSSVRTENIIYRNLPKKTIDLEPLSRRDGFRVIDSYYSDKQITISGTLISDTEDNLKILIDAMKTALNPNEANLDIDDGSSVLRWTATVENINIPEKHFHISHVPFEISFTCQPFGYMTTATTSTAVITTSTDSGSIVISGSASPRPKIKWTVSGTPTTAITAISFTNVTTTDTITISSLVLDDDNHYVEVDTDEMTVVQNIGAGDVTHDFTGIFPRFNTSTNSYTISITGGGASKTLNQVVTYNASYL